MTDLIKTDWIPGEKSPVHWGTYEIESETKQVSMENYSDDAWEEAASKVIRWRGVDGRIQDEATFNDYKRALGDPAHPLVTPQPKDVAAKAAVPIARHFVSKRKSAYVVSLAYQLAYRLNAVLDENNLRARAKVTAKLDSRQRHDLDTELQHRDLAS